MIQKSHNIKSRPPRVDGLVLITGVLQCSFTSQKRYERIQGTREFNPKVLAKYWFKHSALHWDNNSDIPLIWQVSLTNKKRWLFCTKFVCVYHRQCISSLMVNRKTWIIIWRLESKPCFLQRCKICLGGQTCQWTNKRNVHTCKYYYKL